MPFGEYKDFDDCVSKNKDKDDPSAYCGSIKAKIEKDNPVELIDSTKIEDALSILEEIDSKKESGKITQEEHDIRSKVVLENLEKSKIVDSEIKKPEVVNKAMHSRVGKKRVIMTRSDGIKQHYFMNPEEIKAYRAKGREVVEIPEGTGEDKDKEKTVAIDFDGTIVELENSEKLIPGAKEGLQEIADMGYTIIIFSGRGTKDLEQRLDKLGIDTYDYINDNPEEHQPGGKLVADKYIDDKNVEFKGDWKVAISKLKGDKMKNTDEIKEEMNEEVGTEEEMNEEVGDEVKKIFGKKPKTESSVPPLESRQTKKEPTSWDEKWRANLNKKEEKKPEPKNVPGTAAPKTREYLKERGLLKEGEEYPYLEEHLKEALKILDKCPKTKDMSKTEKIQIVQDTLNNINPVKEPEMEKEYPVEKTDNIDELKSLVEGFTHRLSAMEEHLKGKEVKKAGGLTVHPTKNYNLTMPNLPIKDDKASEREEASQVKKAEPIKTLPLVQSQKEQSDKQLGGAKTVVNSIVKSDVLDMNYLANIKFDKVNEIAEKLMGRRI